MADAIDLSPLKSLTESTRPVWGIMSAQHMVEHLILAVQISNGKLENLDCMNPEEKLPVLRRFLLSARPLPKNFINTVIGSELKALFKPDLDSAKKELIQELENIEEFFSSNPEAKPINPTFGPLNKEEWIIFHKKHCTHHFTQFGLIEK